MSAKFLMFVFIVFMLGQFLCLIADTNYVGAQEVDLINNLTGYTTLEIQEAGVWTIPKLAGGFFINGLPKMISWNYSCFNGSWQIVKWFLLYPLSIAIVFGVSMLFVNVISGIFRP